jgi:hypothetical protein
MAVEQVSQGLLGGVDMGRSCCWLARTSLGWSSLYYHLPACLPASCLACLPACPPAQVIEPVRSRCLCIRVAAPTQQAIEAQLHAVAGGEKLSLPPHLAARLAAGCDRNLRRALLSLEACKVQQYPFDEGQEVSTPDWEMYIQVGRRLGGWVGATGFYQMLAVWTAVLMWYCCKPWPRCTALTLPAWLPARVLLPAPLQEIAGDVLGEQSPKRLFQVRAKLYELLVNCIPPEVGGWGEGEGRMLSAQAWVLELIEGGWRVVGPRGQRAARGRLHAPSESSRSLPGLLPAYCTGAYLWGPC